MLNSGGHFTFKKRIATIVTGNVGALGAGGVVNITTQYRTVGSVKLSTVAYSHPHYAVNATPTTVTCFIDATGGLNVGDFIYTNFGLTNKKYSSNPLLTGQTLYIENYDENIYAIDFNANGSIKTIYNAATAAPTPTYSITPSTTSINEGQSVTFNIATTWVNNDTTLYWSDSGTVGSADFTQGIASGSINISTPNFAAPVSIGTASNSSSGSGSFLLTAANDSLTEGNETLIARLRTGSTSGTIVATASTVTVVDTTPTYAIVPNVTSINEGGSVTYTITTTNVANGTVLYWSNNPEFAAASGGTSINDFTQQVMSGQVTINNNTGSFILTASSDMFTEYAQEQIKINLRTGSTSGIIIASAVDVYINDTSQDPYITVTSNVASNVKRIEGETIIFTITGYNLNSNNVNWSISGTGISAADVSPGLSGATTLVNGTKQISILVSEDTIIEPVQTLTFSVSGTSWQGTETASTSVSITDAAPTISIVSNTYSMLEGDTATFTVSTNNIANGTILPWWIPAVWTNTEDHDFVGNDRSGNVTINNNTGTFSLTTEFNGIESTEYFKVEVGGTEYTRGDGTTHTLPTGLTPQINILDSVVNVVPDKTTMNEGDTVTWTISSPTLPPGTVLTWDFSNNSYNSGNGTVSQHDFVENITNGSVTLNANSQATVSLTARYNASEGGEVILFNVYRSGVYAVTSAPVTLYNSIFTITPNKTSIYEGETITYTIGTTNVTSGSQFAWFRTGGTSSDADFTSVTNTGTFTIINGSATVSFTAKGDTISDNDETIVFGIRTISTDNTSLQTHTTVKIKDPYLTITPNTTSIQEGTGAITYTIASGGVSSPLTWSRTGTASQLDFSETGISGFGGTIALNSSGAGTLVLTPIDEDVIENNETITVSVSGSTLGGIAISATATAVTITNAPSTYSVSPNTTSINEGGSVTFTITTSDVEDGTILFWENIGTTAPADFSSPTTDTGTVTINNNTGAVTFNSTIDGVTEGTQTIILRLRAVSQSGSIVATSSTVNVLDVATYSIATAGNVTSVNEGSSVTFNITTSAVPNNTTLYWTNNGTSVAADVYPAAASGSFTINNNAGSVALLAYNDTNTEGAETIIFKVRTGSITGPIVATKTVTINDTSLDPIYYGKYVGCLDEINGVINTLTVSSGSNAWPDTFAYEGICYGFDGTVSSAENGSITQYLTNTYGSCVECAEIHQPATYTVTGPAGINEGGIATFTVTTTNTTDATYYWTLAGVSSADVTPFTGTVTTVSGTKNVSILAYTDETTEGVEFMTFQLRSGSAAGPILATYQVTVNDTSTTPPIGGCYDYTLLNEVGTSASITYYNCAGGVLATTKPKTLTLAGGQQNTTGCTNLDNVTLPYGWSIVDQTPC